MNKDDFIYQLQSSYGKVNNVDSEDIKEWIMLEDLSSIDVAQLYKIVKRNHNVNYFPKYGQIIKYWEQYGTKDIVSIHNIVDRDYVMGRSKDMSIGDIIKYINIYRKKMLKTTYECLFISIFDDVAHGYGIKMQKYDNESLAIEAAEDIKIEIYAGRNDYEFDYVEDGKDVICDTGERSNAVLPSRDVIGSMF